MPSTMRVPLVSAFRADASGSTPIRLQLATIKQERQERKSIRVQIVGQLNLLQTYSLVSLMMNHSAMVISKKFLMFVALVSGLLSISHTVLLAILG
jgi:hypothetical protein